MPSTAQTTQLTPYTNGARAMVPRSSPPVSFLLPFGKNLYHVPASAMKSYPKWPNDKITNGDELGALIHTKAPEKWLPYCKPDYLCRIEGDTGNCVYTTFKVPGHSEEVRILRHITATVAAKNFESIREEALEKVEAEGVAALDGRARPVVLEPRGRAALLQLDLAERLGVAPHLVSLRSRRRPQPGAPLLHQVHRLVAPRHRGGQLPGTHQTFARAKQRDTPVALQQVPDRLTADEGLRREFVEGVDRHPSDAHDAFPSLRRVERVAGPTRAPALERTLSFVRGKARRKSAFVFPRRFHTLGRYKTLSPTERARALSRLYFCAFFYRGAGKLTTLYHRSYKRRTVQASSSRRVQILCATLSCCLKESSRFCIYKRKNEGETKL